MFYIKSEGQGGLLLYGQKASRERPERAVLSSEERAKRLKARNEILSTLRTTPGSIVVFISYSCGLFFDIRAGVLIYFRENALDSIIVIPPTNL